MPHNVLLGIIVVVMLLLFAGIIAEAAAKHEERRQARKLLAARIKMDSDVQRAARIDYNKSRITVQPSNTEEVPND